MILFSKKITFKYRGKRYRLTLSLHKNLRSLHKSIGAARAGYCPTVGRSIGTLHLANTDLTINTITHEVTHISLAIQAKHKRSTRLFTNYRMLSPTKEEELYVCLVENLQRNVVNCLRRNGQVNI